MAITEYYVDPAIDANSGTGTIGDPFGDLQYALNTVTRDATNGDRFNIKAGTAEVLTAGLSLATYGSPGAAAPLWFQGYTSAAGDGGIGEINNGGANVPVFRTADNSNKTNISFVDMKMGNCGTAQVIQFFSYNSLINCEVWGSSASPAVHLWAGYNRAIGCYFHSFTGNSNIHIQDGDMIGSRLVSSAGGSACQLSVGVLMGCLFEINTDTSLNAISITGTPAIVIGNTIYSASANTGAGVTTGSSNSVIMNNVIVGFSGAGGRGIEATSAATGTALAANAFYNNTTNESIGGKVEKVLAAGVSLAADPFIDAAGGDFEIDGDSDASEAAWPSMWKGLATTTNAADIGAVQSGAGSGGGVSIYTRSVRVIKG